MRLKTAIVGLAAICHLPAAFAQEKPTAVVDVPPRDLISSPAPEYPYAARARKMSGRGLVLMEINPKTGRVTAARMEKSTGHRILDSTALQTFERWRFKPGTVRQVFVTRASNRARGPK